MTDSQVDDLTLWNLQAGTPWGIRTADAIESTGFHNTSAVGTYTYFAIPTSLITDATGDTSVVFRENGNITPHIRQGTTSFGTHGGAGYTVFRFSLQQRSTDITYTITL